MLEELKIDFSVYKNNIETPIFHRIKFNKEGFSNSANVYLTKASFYDVRTSRNYRIFPWHDYRARDFLGFELDQESPALGTATLIGMFKPSQNDLEDVQYITNQGKSYFSSAYKAIESEFSKKEEEPEEVLETKKINIESFMKMGEIIPTGAQGKAIYGEGNYIIDGPAGTGKSTTVLQKIKIIQNQNVSLNQIVILVKNEQVVQAFNGLLQSIGVTNFGIYSVDQFIDEIGYSRNDMTDQNLISYKNKALNFIKLFEACTNINNRTRNNQSSQSKNIEQDNELKDKINRSKKLFSIFLEFIKDCDALSQSKIDNSIEFSSFEKAISENYNEFKLQLENDFLSKNKELTNFNVAESIRKKCNTLYKSQQIQLSSKRKKLDKKEKKLMAKAENKLGKLEKEFYSDNTFNLISEDDIEADFLARYANKYKKFMSTYHTIIIDEAQDVSSSKIEIVRLYASNIILTGDELQKETSDGIGNWSNILNKEAFFKDDDDTLNIYKLKHNFRQTYELGNMSYNYRQLVLKQPIIDIKDEYFENQKGFRKPEFVLINEDNDFINLVKNKIRYIKTSFTTNFPLVIFYENNTTLSKFKRILNSENIAYTVDIDFNKEVFLLNVEKIAGREFPVVITPVSSRTLPNSIYIMISRVKFDLSIITFSKKIENHIETLIKKEIILSRQ
ncbi:MAG: AAA family ATPase [Candidatus Competibacteraceae bacterium]|nr:MAG: AAA family ATPase [Candidatus Competibacteraceae bacterium]